VTRDIFRTFLIHLFEHPPLSDRSATFTFLPAWSPALNPIEYAFSKWKWAYRAHYPSTEDEVDQAIEASASSITPQDCITLNTLSTCMRKRWP
jgi:transposase